MDSKATRESRKRLWPTRLQIENCETIFLSPSDLLAFGIEARKVGTAADGDPQFEPRYFERHPEQVLRKYPIDPKANNEHDFCPLYWLHSFQGGLDTVRETGPESGDLLEAAQKLFEERLKDYNSWGNYAHGEGISVHIEDELSARRGG